MTSVVVISNNVTQWLTSAIAGVATFNYVPQKQNKKQKAFQSQHYWSGRRGRVAGGRFGGDSDGPEWCGTIKIFSTCSDWPAISLYSDSEQKKSI